MFAHGLVEEVRDILARGFTAECKPFESHGYKQSRQLLRGELTPRDALFYAQRNTRKYAKRQITWFRREPGLIWLKGFGEAPEIRAAALAHVQRFLSASA
jgi:tRNA dimethylallyltransferase